MKQNVVFAGLDMGSFKTSIVSSNNMQEVIFSAVGWPKDYVARGVIGQDVVIGKEALEKRLALNVVRPFERGMLKYLSHTEAGISQQQVEKQIEAARLLVERVVSSVRPGKDAALYGVLGAPARASLANKQMLIDIARRYFDAVMIVSEPFAVAYSMNRLNDTLVIDIGAGTVDICRLYGTVPTEEDQLTVPIAGDSIDDEFCRRLHEVHPEARVSKNMARQIKERYGCVHEDSERIVLTLATDRRPKQFDVTEPLKEACRSIVPPIIEGVRQLIATFDAEFQPRLLSNVLLAGGGSQIRGLDKLIEDALQEFGGARVTKVYDPVFGGAMGALKLAMGMPKEYWHEIEQLDRAKEQIEQFERAKGEIEQFDPAKREIEQLDRGQETDGASSSYLAA